MENTTNFCDLHTHSTASDGKDMPDVLIDRAVSVGLGAIALCDHNTLRGVPDFLKAAEGKPITAVAGIEISANYCAAEPSSRREHELHILALFVPAEAYGVLTDMTDRANEWKRESNRALVSALRREGFSIDYEALVAKYEEEGGSAFNRSHVAQELIDLGYYPKDTEIKPIIKTLLSEERGLYVPPQRLDALRVIEVIRECRALPVVAHPFLNMTRDELRVFLPEAKAHGLVGMEAYYTTYDRETTECAEAFAAEFGLLTSGGSDYHGSAKPHTALGTGYGDLRIPMAVFETLKATAEAL